MSALTSGKALKNGKQVANVGARGVCVCVGEDGGCGRGLLGRKGVETDGMVWDAHWGCLR